MAFDTSDKSAGWNIGDKYTADLNTMRNDAHLAITAGNYDFALSKIQGIYDSLYWLSEDRQVKELFTQFEVFDKEAREMIPHLNPNHDNPFRAESRSLQQKHDRLRLIIREMYRLTIIIMARKKLLMQLKTELAAGDAILGRGL